MCSVSAGPGDLFITQLWVNPIEVQAEDSPTAKRGVYIPCCTEHKTCFLIRWLWSGFTWAMLSVKWLWSLHVPNCPQVSLVSHVLISSWHCMLVIAVGSGCHSSMWIFLALHDLLPLGPKPKEQYPSGMSRPPRRRKMQGSWGTRSALHTTASAPVSLVQ